MRGTFQIGGRRPGRGSAPPTALVSGTSLLLAICLSVAVSPAAAISRSADLPQEGEDPAVDPLERELAVSPAALGPSLLPPPARAERRGIARRVIERSSANGGRQRTLEVVEETERLDARTVRLTRTVRRPGPGSARGPVRWIEERREEGPGGRLSVHRTTSEPDLNGRPRATRREVATITPLGGGRYRTEIEVAVPEVDGRGFVAVERVEQTERRVDGRVVEVERTRFRRPRTGTRGWQTEERRVLRREGERRESRVEETVHRLDGNGRLSLRERIVAVERTGPEGTESATVEVLTTDLPFAARSRAPSLYRKIELSREPLPGGGRRAVREIRERRLSGFELVERVVEESRPVPGGVESVRTVQRPDGNGRLRTVSVERSESSGS